jgi:hypothetical protein
VGSGEPALIMLWSLGDFVFVALRVHLQVLGFRCPESAALIRFRMDDQDLNMRRALLQAKFKADVTVVVALGTYTAMIKNGFTCYGF